MKKSILAMLAVAMLFGTVSAQTGMKALKKANKQVSKYVSNMSKNGENLDNAFRLIEEAFKAEEVMSSAKAWNMKAAMFNKIANAEINSSLLPGGSKINNLDAGILAYEAYNKAIEVAKKSKYKSTAYIGLMETENHVNNIGITVFQDKDYATAYKNFDIGVNIYNILKENKKKSRLDIDSVRADHIFYTAISAYYGEMNEEAAKYFTQTIDNGTAQALAYDAMYKINSATDEEKALKYLSDGRVAFPDDTGLLFAEINHYLKAGKLEALISKLKSAIEKEPNNVSVYVTMGNVFDQLQVKATENNEPEKATEYFNSALDYYNQALARDEKNFDAIYSIGTLYYNKAANMTTKINEYANDFSKEGMAKYDAAKAEMDATFVQSLPHFEKAIALKGNDLNTLLALKEIYARQDNLEKSEEMKVKIEKIKAERGM